jgi:hypothetical protein
MRKLLFEMEVSKMKYKILLETAKDANYAKRFKNHIRFILLIKCLVVFLFVGLFTPEVNANFENDYLFSYNIDQETDQFLKAKELVFKGNWNDARLQLEKYLVKFPKGHYQDEALYWLAKSLYKLSSQEVVEKKSKVLKEEASEKLDLLIDSFPKSLWKDDSEELRLTIAGELFIMGNVSQKQIIDKYLSSQSEQKEFLDNIFFNTVISMKSEVALGIIDRVFEVNEDLNIRKKAVSILGKYFFEEGRSRLEEIKEEDPNSIVKREAKYWIDFNEMSKIPTQLVYYGYSVEISDRKEKSRIPENKINIYSISRVNLENKVNVEDRVNQFFNQKLLNMKFVTNSTADFSIFGGEISNNIQGFNFKIIQENLQKDWDEITGQLRFRDNETKKEFKKQFVANEKNDQLLTMRKGNRLALILLHFEKITPYVKSGFVSIMKNIDKEKPFYHSEFSNVLGCKVLSTRGNFSMEEITKEGSVSDFGQAKAEIPTKNGTWILLGNIIVDRHSRKFIARNAELSNKDSKVVLKASQIIVPIDEPEKYKVVGKK